ncbi:MAG: hypothetical protein ACI9VR_000924 [Cognaticolwellia sp.]
MRTQTWIAALIAATCFVLALVGLKVREQSAVPDLQQLPPLNGQGLRVRLLTPQGKPVGECRSNLWEPMPGGAMKMGPNGQSICRGGVLYYPDLEPGTYRFQAAAKGLSLLDEKVVIVEGQGIDLGDRSLAIAATLRGEVRFQGQPVPGARVRLDQEYFDNPIERDGSFRVPAALGPHTLTAAKDSMTGSAQVNVGLESENFVVIDLEEIDEPGTLGLQLEPVPEGQRVTAMHPKGPAAALLVVGEVIVSADGKSIAGLSLSAAAVMLGGPPESIVALVNAQGEEKTLTRVPRSALD